ncbi:hypothetical protein CsatB_015392 [Cannabis sativa]
MENLKPNPANSSPLTPLGYLERAALVYGDCPSVLYNRTTYTWSETNSRCLRVASSIIKWLGVKPGQVVSVISPNVPAMYELQFAVPMAGAVLSNINTRLDARIVSVMLLHSESKLVFVDELSVDLILDAISRFPLNTQIPRLVLIRDHGVVSSTSSSSSNHFDKFFCEYEELVARGDPEFQWLKPTSEWDPMVLNYTSGTTSAPKGVVQSHRTIFTVTLDSLLDWSVPKQAVFLWTLPMFHANGWCYTWGTAAVGATNVCLRKFDGPIIFDLIRRHGVTHMCGAPVVLNMLSNTPNVATLEKPVQILTAGAPPPAADRSKDVIISGGENVSSVEVESILYDHPAVDEAAVVAWPHDFWGETPCAFITVKKGTRVMPNKMEIVEYCREKLPHYMVPKVVVFRDELPKTSTGKIQKFILKDIARTMRSPTEPVAMLRFEIPKTMRSPIGPVAWIRI